MDERVSEWASQKYNNTTLWREARSWAPFSSCTVLYWYHLSNGQEYVNCGGIIQNSWQVALTVFPQGDNSASIPPTPVPVFLLCPTTKMFILYNYYDKRAGLKHGVCIAQCLQVTSIKYK